MSSHSKKHDGDAAAEAKLMNMSSNGSIASTGSASGVQRRRRAARGTILLNFGLSITLFFALVQIFDPTLHEHHENDIAHHNVYQNPLHNGLAEFSHGKDKIWKGNDHEKTREDVIQGRERIMGILEEAGIAKELSISQIEKLPKWEEIVDLYGDNVVIVGKDECDKFTEQVPPNKAILAIAGLFNTGTNYLDSTIRRNIKTVQPNIWQVSWGKHRMAEVKWNHTAPQMEQYDKRQQLPIVVVRDPFSWMQSMCSHPYATVWRHGEHHCPNLVPNEEDKEQFNTKGDYFSVSIKFDKNSVYHYESLVHLWSEWYMQYYEADYPVLMVRFEDLVFQPAAVLREIAHCVKGELKIPIQYQLKTSKAHGSGTDYIKAIIKTADSPSRYHNLTMKDLDFAKKFLNPTLMEVFQYNVPKPPVTK